MVAKASKAALNICLIDWQSLKQNQSIGIQILHEKNDPNLRSGTAVLKKYREVQVYKKSRYLRVTSEKISHRRLLVKFLREAPYVRAKLSIRHVIT